MNSRLNSVIFVVSLICILKRFELSKANDKIKFIYLLNLNVIFVKDFKFASLEINYFKNFALAVRKVTRERISFED